MKPYGPAENFCYAVAVVFGTVIGLALGFAAITAFLKFILAP